jgi:hypothetical protein
MIFKCIIPEFKHILQTLIINNGEVFGFYVRDSTGNTRNTINNTFDDLTITTTNTPTISASVPLSSK